MPTTPPNSPLTIPDRFGVFPLGSVADSPLMIAIVARTEPDEVHGPFIRLRDHSDCSVYLCAVIDRSFRVHRWLEIWVQEPERLQGSAQAALRNLTNHALDTRWDGLARTMLDGAPAEVMSTGWESGEGRVFGLDDRNESVSAFCDDESGEAWTLCRDEAILQARGLPGYASSLDRYLYLPSKGSNSPMLAVDDDSPIVEGTQRLSEALTKAPHFHPLNHSAGRLLVRTRSDLALASFLDFLHGEFRLADSAAAALEDPREIIEAGGVPAGGYLFTERSTKEQRHLEQLLIKLRVINELLVCTRNAVRALRRPILNLRPDSFGVRFARPGGGLPAFWTASAHINDFGEALAYRVEGTDTVTYVRLCDQASPIYQPERLSETQSGVGTVRLRATSRGGDGAVSAEGTMLPTSPIRVDRHDIVSLRLPVGSQRIALHARLESETALAADEWRFRTIPVHLDATVAGRFKEAEGGVFSNVAFEIIPRLGSPVDLFSLGVIAARVLFGNSGRSMAVVKDELLSFARQVAANHDESSSLRLRIQSLFRGDERWLDSLGPQLVLGQEVEPSEAFAAIPIELWCEILALLVRLFPGVGPDSWCQDYLGSQAGGLHQVFDGPVREAEEMVARARSVLFADWNENREITEIIQKQLDTHLATRIAENA